MFYCCSSVEILEARIAPATLYVGKSNSFLITNDVTPAGLSAGDTVTWDPGSGSSHGSAIEGLIFGTNAFNTITAAVAAADPDGGDVIRIGPGTFTEQVIVRHSLQLLGNQAGVDARGRTPINETIMNNTGGSLLIVADDVLVDGFLFEGQRAQVSADAAVTAEYDSSGTNEYTGFKLENSIFHDNAVGLSWSNMAGAQSIVRHNWFIDNSKGELGIGNAIHAGGPLVDAQLLENRFSGAHGIHTVELTREDSSNIVVQGNEFLDGNSLALQQISGFTVRGNTFSGVQTGLPYGPSEALSVYMGSGQILENSFTNLGVGAVTVYGELDGPLSIVHNTVNQNVGLYTGLKSVINIWSAKTAVQVLENTVILSGKENAGSKTTALGAGAVFDLLVVRNVFDASAVQFDSNTDYRSAGVFIGSNPDALQTTRLNENVLTGWEIGLQTNGLRGQSTISAWGNDLSGNRMMAIWNVSYDVIPNTLDARFNWFGVSNAKAVAQIVTPYVNTEHFALTGEDQSTVSPGFQSAAILDLRKPGRAVFTDVDGDRVTVKTNRGTFAWEDFLLEPGAKGSHLERLTLDESFSGAVVSVTADRSKPAGDGLVSVTRIDARGVDLRSLSIDGNLESVLVGDDNYATPGLGKLTMQSFGSGDPNFGGGGTIFSRVWGDLGKVVVRGSMLGVSLRVSGDSDSGIGQVTIGGNLAGNSNGGSGVISASGDIGSVKIGGSVIAQGGVASGSIVAGGKIGSVSIGHDLSGDRADESGRIVAGTTIGTVVVGGTMNDASIIAGGIASPAKAAEALTIRSVTVKGDVLNSRILAGFVDNALVHSDVQIGSIKVKGDWQSSDVSAGVASCDAFFGNEDDTVPFAGDDAIVSRIAKVVIRGSVVGADNGAYRFGFVAEEIGSFQNGPRRLPFTKADGEAFSLGTAGNVVVREVSGQSL